jgi:histone H3/H4
MPRNKRIIPLASLAREFYDENTSRVSTEALVELSEWLENYGLKLSSKAWELCINSNKKTLMDTDIKIAQELLRKKY